MENNQLATTSHEISWENFFHENQDLDCLPESPKQNLINSRNILPLVKLNKSNFIELLTKKGFSDPASRNLFYEKIREYLNKHRRNNLLFFIFLIYRAYSHINCNFCYY